ncbi:MAG TPA: hypothetical protein VFH44_11660 [Solirubrobacterales bacterium]|nr:hypothetical protein [Solirubrobacterales bacterium]
MGELRLSGAAAGPAPWESLAGLIIAASGLGWAAQVAGELAVALVAMATIVGFWLIVPKGSSSPRLSGWIVLVMVPAFIAMLFVPVLYGTLHRGTIGVGYAVGFILWLQVGLWLADRFEPIHEGGHAGAGAPRARPRGQSARSIVLATVIAGLLAMLVYGVIERAGRTDAGEPVGAVPAGVYPPASSTAGPMTPEWTQYAAAIDRACALNYNRTLAVQRDVELRAAQESWTGSATSAAIQQLWADNQRALAGDVRSLGEAPAKPELLRRWLANVELRGALFAAMAAANRRGEPKDAWAAGRRLHRLKRRADLLGRDFGLRICTSN